jgi:SAM-dependent methyltransferase
MTIANQDQSDRWNSGDDGIHWIAEKDRYDRMLEPAQKLLMASAELEMGQEILDVGCGSGATTLEAAGRVAPGRVLGLDLSGPMLDRARSDAERARLDNVEFVRGDAQTLEWDRSFDVVISRFGVMFFENPGAAFANLHTACRRGGRLVFVSWQPMIENEWLLVPGAALAEHVPLPDPAPTNAPGMFGLSDPDRIRQLLDGAGWNEVTVAPRHAPLLIGGGGTVEETLRFLRTGSLGRAMLDGVGPEVEARALQSIREVLQSRADEEGVRLDAAMWLVSASA